MTTDQARVDLAGALRWSAKLNLHEGVANHFSLAINDSGSRFLMNPNQRHFRRRGQSHLRAAFERPLTLERSFIFEGKQHG
jgi:ribulose-5-phosphate 4-epimerase/fuculose-1-phosphate aldolase